jgi:hypothetical protein
MNSKVDEKRTNFDVCPAYDSNHELFLFDGWAPARSGAGRDPPKLRLQFLYEGLELVPSVVERPHGYVDELGYRCREGPFEGRECVGDECLVYFVWANHGVHERKTNFDVSCVLQEGLVLREGFPDLEKGE